MSNAQWEYENQEFLKARYEDKKWYTVRKHVCLECGKEYYTICRNSGDDHRPSPSW